MHAAVHECQRWKQLEIKEEMQNGVQRCFLKKKKNYEQY